MSKILLKVYNDVTYVEGSLEKKMYQEFRKTVGYKPENANYMIQSKGIDENQWDGTVSLVCNGPRWCKCEIKKSGIHFPTGLVSVARSFFSKWGIPYAIKDCRAEVIKNCSLEMSDWFEARDYQADAVVKCAEAQRGMLVAATGAGKTAMGANLIQTLGVSPFIFFVPSIDLLEQTKESFENFLRQNGQPATIGAVGGGQCDIQDITVMTQQTACRALGIKVKKSDDEDKIEKDSDEVKARYKDITEYIHETKGMIADECQHWAARSCQGISDHTYSAKYKYGFSATPFRDQNDDILIEACFSGKIIKRISASYLIERDYLVQPNIYFVPVKNMRGKTGGHTYQQVYKEAIVENPIRNNYIANIANNMREQDKQILILVKNIEHGNILKNMIPNSEFLSGRWSSKRRQEHLAKMRAKDPVVTIATVIFDEGIDVRPLDTLILGGSGKSCTRALQRVGRIIRPYTSTEGIKKSEATVIDFMDDCKYLLSHSRRRKNIYNTEPLFNIENLQLS